MKFRVLLAAAVAFLVAVPTAQAHITLMQPRPRAGTNQKQGPCGGVAKAAMVVAGNKFTAGQKIMVVWNETVPHPGHFRIAFDPNGDAMFRNPMGYMDIQMVPVLPILADGVHRHTSGSGMRMFEVTLPNVTCKTCTLQLIQMMTDKAPYSPSFTGDDIYYACADIEINAPDGGAGGSGGVGGAAGPDGGARDAGGAGGTGGVGTGGTGGGTGGSGGSGGVGTGGTGGGSGGMTGTGGSGGNVGTGGSPGTGGVTGTGGSPPAGGSGGTTPPRRPDSGGGCAIAGQASTAPAVGVLLAAALAALRARRRRR